MRFTALLFDPPRRAPHHQLDPKIGTEITEGPESECKDGGDTSINVPGDNVVTDVISPQEGAFDEKVMNLLYYHLMLH
jgi:hypothetical protein